MEPAQWLTALVYIWNPVQWLITPVYIRNRRSGWSRQFTIGTSAVADHNSLPWSGTGAVADHASLHLERKQWLNTPVYIWNRCSGWSLHFTSLTSAVADHASLHQEQALWLITPIHIWNRRIGWIWNLHSVLPQHTVHTVGIWKQEMWRKTINGNVERWRFVVKFPGCHLRYIGSSGCRLETQNSGELRDVQYYYLFFFSFFSSL